MEENRECPIDSEETQESNAARRIRVLEKDDGSEAEKQPIRVNKWSNFWYHHKWKVIIISAFTFMIGVALAQVIQQSSPDVRILYAGPDYISPNMNQKFCDVMENLMEDYDGNGKKYAQLTDFVFMTEGQLADFEAKLEEAGENGTVDRFANAQASERFIYEIFGSEASLCFLARDQYEMVKASGGFLPLSEVFGDEIPDGAVDDCGVLLRDTKLYKFYDAVHIFPEDTVVALRRLSTMSAITGKSKAEKLHARGTDVFKKLLTFEYPEGYTPAEE